LTGRLPDSEDSDIFFVPYDSARVAA